MTIGKADYERFKRGEQLTHRTAILAQCYVCNGMGEGGEDCKGKSCPLYQFMPYRADRVKKAATPEQLEALRQARLVRRSTEK